MPVRRTILPALVCVSGLALAACSSPTSPELTASPGTPTSTQGTSDPGARETLQRYAITFWLLSGNPSMNRSTLEKESRTLAQRLSVLHGINSPEFFDKAVFSSLVLTLRDEGYISDTGDAEPEETLKVYRMLADLITSDVRLTIESVTQDDA